MRGALEVAREKYGGVTAVINCAGIGVAIRTLSKKGPHPLDEFKVGVRSVEPAIKDMDKPQPLYVHTILYKGQMAGSQVCPLFWRFHCVVFQCEH